MYLVETLPDTSFAVNSLIQFMVELSRVHWTTTKHILRYLVGIVDYGLEYRRSSRVAWLVSHIQIGKVVLHTRRALSVVVSVWARQQCRGSVGNRSPLH